MDPKLYDAASKNALPDFSLLDSDGGFQRTSGKGNTILHVAVSSGSQESVTHILNWHRNPSFPCEPNNDGDTPLHIAARLGHLEVATLLADHLESPGVLEAAINPFRALNAKKNSVLHEAVKKGHTEIAELLLRKDEYLPSFNNAAGESPLFLAVDRGYFDIALLIFKNSPNCSLSGRNGMTVMHAATIRFQNHLLQEVLKKNGSEILEVPDDFGRMPLHYAARFGNDFAVKLYVKTNSSLACIKDDEGRTALHIAARNGHCPTIRSLIEGRPDICELSDNRGQTALHVAIECSEANVVKLLLDAVAFVDLVDKQDQEGNTSLHIAATKCDFENLKVLTKRIDKGVINNKRMTAVDIIMETKDLTRLGKARTEMLLGKSGALPSLDKSYTNNENKQSGMFADKATPEDKNLAGLTREGGTKVVSSTSGMEGNKSVKQWPLLISYLKKASPINLVISTIIVSATYAAGIQVPGGYNSEGLPNLKSKADFNFFLLFNSMAFGSAVGSMVTYFIDELIPMHGIEPKIMTIFDKIRFSSTFLSMVFTLFSCVSLIYSFEYATRAIWFDVSDLQFRFIYWPKRGSNLSWGLPAIASQTVFLIPFFYFVFSLYTQFIFSAYTLNFNRRVSEKGTVLGGPKEASE